MPIENLLILNLHVIVRKYSERNKKRQNNADNPFNEEKKYSNWSDPPDIVTCKYVWIKNKFMNIVLALIRNGNQALQEHREAWAVRIHIMQTIFEYKKWQ